jgi:hypothetical protein
MLTISSKRLTGDTPWTQAFRTSLGAMRYNTPGCVCPLVCCVSLCNWLGSSRDGAAA